MSNTYYVSKTGSNLNQGTQSYPFLTIPYAINIASNDDTIIIMDGTYDYNSTIIINKELYITSQNSDIKPIINVTTASNGVAIQCNASNITINGLKINHSPSTVGFNDTCISLLPGGTPIYPDSGIMVNKNINIIDCEISFTKFGISSKAKFFNAINCIFISSALTTARAIAIYSQDGTINIENNTFTTNISNNAIELVHNNFATNDSYQNKRNGTVNFNNNKTSGINITRRAIFFESGADTGLPNDIYIYNISGNTINTKSDCLFLLQPNNALFLNFIGLITINNNNYINEPTGSNNGLVRIASFVSGNTINNFTNPPKFNIYSNNINNTNLVLSTNPYNVDNKNVLILTGFTGSLPSDINSILSTTGGKQEQTITFNPLPQQAYYENGEILLTATSTSGLVITYSSNNTNVVVVDGNKLIIKETGTSIITASQEGNENYNPAVAVSQSQVITKLIPTINNFTIPNKINGELPFEITHPNSDSNGTFSYSSSNISVASISGNKIIIVDTGDSVITATQNETTNYTSGIITTSFQVSPSTSINPTNIYNNNSLQYFLEHEISTHGLIVDNTNINLLSTSKRFKILFGNNKKIYYKKFV
jgi:ribosomal protein S11